MQIILHSDDMNLLSHWEKACGSKCVVIDEFQDLLNIKNSIIIMNYSVLKDDVKESIQRLKKNSNSIFMLHRVPNLNIGKRLLSFGVNGYGNALMKAHFILSAIDAIQEGLIWLHPEFTSALIEELPVQKENDINSYISSLSEREKEVVYLLKDGATYKKIAEELEITPRTVKAHASSIYTKLQVKDRLALALLLK